MKDVSVYYRYVQATHWPVVVGCFPCYSGQVLRHLLHEAVAPTRLSRQETDEFMAYAEIGGSRSRVDYEALIDKLMF